MSHRRYKIGVNPAYDFEFDLRKGQSGILNRANNSSVSFDLWSESGVQKLLTERLGDEDGQIVDGAGYPAPGRLLAARMAVEVVDQEFEAMVIKAQRSGRFPPTEMPPEMVKEKLVCEARLDICQEEVDQLKKMLAAHAARRKEEQENRVLMFGPKGSTWGSDPPREVDYQPVKWDKKQGHFVINCPKSPYHGVRLPDYYAFVCKPWRDACNKAYREANDKANNLDLGAGERKRAAEEAHLLVTGIKSPPWPPKPEA